MAQHGIEAEFCTDLDVHQDPSLLERHRLLPSVGHDEYWSDWWSLVGARRPEDSFTGVSYRHGGGWWDGPQRTQGFIVQQPDHWVFAGTGLRQGDRFGADSQPPLVGYECDGAPLVQAGPGRFALSPEATACGTPPTFQPPAVGPLDLDWQELPYREQHGDRAGIHSATLGVHEQGGTVFTAGTTDWAQVLVNVSDPHVDADHAECAAWVERVLRG